MPTAPVMRPVWRRWVSDRLSRFPRETTMSKPFEFFTAEDVDKAVNEEIGETCVFGNGELSRVAKALDAILNERGKRVSGRVVDVKRNQWMWASWDALVDCSHEGILLAERPIQEGKRDE